MEGIRPEQARALAYIRAKGTEAPLARVRERVVAAFVEIEALLGSIGEAEARARPLPGWCVQEVVDHLVESHRPAVDQLEAVFAGRPPGEAIPAGLLSADPLGRSWSALLGDLRAIHARLLARLAGEDAPAGSARIPVVMVVKVREPDGSLVPAHWVDEFDAKAFALLAGLHTREHTNQVRRILAAVAPAAS
jgi:hypothetical protein